MIRAAFIDFSEIVKRLSFSAHNLNVILAGIFLSYFSTLFCLGSLVSLLNTPTLGLTSLRVGST